MTFDFDAVPDRGDTWSIKWADHVAVSMGLADMDVPTAPVVLDALRARIDHGVLGYTAIDDSLLDAVVGWLGTRRGWTVDPEWIDVCPGVLPSMAHLLRSAAEPGSGVIVQTPGFGPIGTVIEANGLHRIENPLAFADGRYRMDLDGFRQAARRDDARAFVLCSPHNPVGRVWTVEELEAVAEVCAEEDLLVISDEIHAEVIFPGATFIPYARVAAPGTRHATLMGPSKGFNLAGLRTSVSVIPDDELRARLREELHRVNEDFGVNLMGATALEAAYRAGGPWLDALTAHLHDNVAALTDGLGEHLPQVRVIAPEASFLVWVDLRDLGLDEHEVERRLGARGVKVEPGSAFGPLGTGFVRINVGTSRARVVDAAERIGLALR